jgi:hypothetical protein
MIFSVFKSKHSNERGRSSQTGIADKSILWSNTQLAVRQERQARWIAGQNNARKEDPLLSAINHHSMFHL